MLERPSKPLSFLLLIAGVYQLGASPCGCWEHSGWRQVAVQLSLAVDDHDTDHDGTAVEPAECEHSGFPPAKLTSRSGLMRLELVGLPLDVPSNRLAEATTAPGFTVGRQLGIDELALPMRAELQVFRL